MPVISSQKKTTGPMSFRTFQLSPKEIDRLKRGKESPRQSLLAIPASG
jgi:hypothetical protein